MRKVVVFNNISLDGNFTDQANNVGWAHQSQDDHEWQQFVASNAMRESVLVLGRITYQMMASFWPTPLAEQMSPTIAHAMNQTRKIVFSTTITQATWSNTTLLRGNVESTIRDLKAQSGPPLVILGSGSIVAQLASAGLIDEYQLAMIPVILGSGRGMFSGLKSPIGLSLTNSRVFKNGNTVLTYQQTTTAGHV